MQIFIINLDRATDRWEFIQKAFADSKYPINRISAIDGNMLELPIDDYSESRYLWLHGRPTNPRHVGCYLSHVNAMKAFLETDDEFALIAEDDLILQPNFEEAIEEALTHSKKWNLLRLSGLSAGKPVKIAQLANDYSLNISFGRMKGTGSYIVDRKAAKAFVKHLLPMRLPIDHAMDREWFCGLKSLAVLPFPASQVDSGFKSGIQVGKSLKLPAARRWVTTYPYQIINELSRYLFRGLGYLRAKIT